MKHDNIMKRVNYPITIEMLYEECKKQIAMGNKNKYICISNDEEGNGYHELYFGFGEGEEFMNDRYGVSYPYDLNPKDCMILG